MCLPIWLLYTRILYIGIYLSQFHNRLVHIILSGRNAQKTIIAVYPVKTSTCVVRNVWSVVTMYNVN